MDITLYNLFTNENESYKGENINWDTIKRYFSDIPTNLKKHLGELDNEYFISEINQFLNKVLNQGEKD